MKSQKQNWFDTLNDALNSEDLTEFWPLGSNVQYGQTVSHIIGEGKEQRFISVFRENDGRYERPIQYKIW